VFKVRQFGEAGGKLDTLHIQGWASAEHISEIVAATLKRIKAHLPALQRSLQLYLANRETEFILFRPIKVLLFFTLL